MRADKLRVRTGIGHGDAQLVVTLIHEKDRERRGERDLSCHRQSAGDADHVRFRDADGEEAVGEFFLELGAKGGFRQVGVERDHVWVLRAQLGQRLSVGFAGGHTHLQFEWVQWLCLPLDLHRLKFFHCRRNLVGLRRHAVPLHFALHEGDPFALDGVGDDARRMVGRVVARLLQRRDHLIEVVSIDLDHVPVEGAEFVAERD